MKTKTPRFDFILDSVTKELAENYMLPGTTNSSGITTFAAPASAANPTNPAIPQANPLDGQTTPQPQVGQPVPLQNGQVQPEADEFAILDMVGTDPAKFERFVAKAKGLTPDVLARFVSGLLTRP